MVDELTSVIANLLHERAAWLDEKIRLLEQLDTAKREVNDRLTQLVTATAETRAALVDAAAGWKDAAEAWAERNRLLEILRASGEGWTYEGGEG